MSIVKVLAKKDSTIYVHDGSMKITHIYLQEKETVFINAANIIAFEPTLSLDIISTKNLAKIITNGFFSVNLSGPGWFAVATWMDPLTMPVSFDSPVFCNPRSLVLWSGNLQYEVKTGFSIGTFFGRGSGEELHLKFTSNESGYILIQTPYDPLVNGPSI